MLPQIAYVSRKYKTDEQLILSQKLFGTKDFMIFPGGILDEPAIETKFAPYGSSLEMDCRLDLDPPIQYQWNKLGGLLPRDSQTYEVHEMHIYYIFSSN